MPIVFCTLFCPVDIRTRKLQIVLEWFEFWDQIFEYSDQTDYNISSFLALTLSKPVHREDFFDKLMSTNQIAVVISDKSNVTKSVLVFRGNRDPFTWYSLPNLISSSFWEITPEDSSISMSFDSTGLRIVKKMNNEQEQIYAWVMCGQFSEVCRNKFADTVNGESIANLQTIGKLKIYVTTDSRMDIEWNLQFAFSAESKINFEEFYFGTTKDLFNQKSMFRVLNFENELQNAAKILVRVHLGPFWTKDLQFDVREDFTTFKSWFSENHLIDGNSFLKIDRDMDFSFSDGVDSFFILEHTSNSPTDNCKNRLWGLRIVCKYSSTLDSCSVFDSTSVEKECQILFSKTWTSWENDNYLKALAVEIYSKPMIKIFSFDYSSAYGIHVFDFYQERTIYTGNQPVFRHHDIDKSFEKCSFAIMRLYYEKEIGQEYIFRCAENSKNWFTDSNLVVISNIDNSDEKILQVSIEDYSWWHRYNRDFFFSLWEKHLYEDEDWSLYDNSVGAEAGCTRNNVDHPCVHYYSAKFKEEFRRSRASKMEIITYNSPFSYIGKNWQLVFSVDAYSGIHLYNYFKEGSTLPAVPGLSEVRHAGIFRHPLLQSRLSDAAYIRFTVYDVTKSQPVHYLTFEPRSGDGMENWFTWDRVVESSLWEFETGADDLTFMIRIPADGHHLRNHRFFNIQYNWAGCAEDTGWFLATIKYSEMDPTCAGQYEWEKWWASNVSLHNQPPAFYFATTAARMLNKQMSIGGKITLEVIV